GMTDVVFGPWVWRREHTGVWLGSERRGEWFHADERYRLARASGCEISRAGWTETELSDIAEHRWWTIAEIAATSDAVFVPRRLATLLPPVLAGHLPPEPIRVE
ncbi:MAG: hypothetical protein ABI782_01900, partial [Anaerolineaceae bacterium]